MIRPLPRVCSHVRRDAGTLAEPTIAYGTPKRLLTGMSPDMGSQIGSLREALVAVSTPVRSFTRVGAKVGLQRAGPSVCLAADTAEIGFLFIVF